MRFLSYIVFTTLLIYSCGTSKKANIDKDTSKEEAVIIENDSLEYKIIIIDPGFTLYLNSIAKPANFYSQAYYENKNKFYVSEWNYRAMNPIKYKGFYENQIDYLWNIDYGLDVNYKLYNYFKFVEYKYKIRF